MARPRRFSNQQLVEVAAQAIVERSDGTWSLADVARVSGMSPAALIKRFGSKAGLLHAVMEQWVAELPIYTPSAATDPAAEIVCWVSDLATPHGGSAAARSNLTLLHDELTREDTRELLCRGREQQADYIRAALIDAHKRGILAVEPPTETAEIWMDLLTGAALRAAISDPEVAFARVVRHITDQLDDWRTA